MTNNTQMLKGILEGCVLKIISEKPCYSAELVSTLREKGFEEVAEGTLFPLLLRLEREGLFETERVANALGPSRKYYRLSGMGKAELARFVQVWRAFRRTIDDIIEEEPL